MICIHNGENNCSHIVKGTTWASLMLITILCVAIITAGVLGLSGGLLAWDGMFCYSWIAANPLHAFWAIPVTLAFIAIDDVIIYGVGTIAAKVIRLFSFAAKSCGGNMINHYRSIRRVAPMRVA